MKRLLRQAVQLLSVLSLGFVFVACCLPCAATQTYTGVLPAKKSIVYWLTVSRGGIPCPANAHFTNYVSNGSGLPVGSLSIYDYSFPPAAFHYLWGNSTAYVSYTTVIATKLFYLLKNDTEQNLNFSITMPTGAFGGPIF
jgi:hypothetical protein